MENFATSLAELKEKKGVMVALIAVILVPLIYAAIILTASWGPYDNLSNLPVAVVNEDAGAMNGDEKINVGDQLVDTLKESKSLGFEFVSASEAKKGMDELKYYMMIEIPEDFSQKVTTVMDASPQVPELKYTQNEGLHFMAAQVTGKAADQIREELGNKITETYVANVFSQLEQVAAGFQDGADGSLKLNEGAVKLQDGTGQILESLESKSGDIAKLADGSQTLKAGTNELLTSIQGGTSGVSQLADGSKALAAGAGTLNAGAKELNTGANQVNSGAKDLNNGAKELNTGAKTLNQGAKDLKAGTSQVLAGLKSAQAGSGSLNDGVQQLAAGSKELSAGVDQAAAGISQLAPGSKQVADGIDQLGQHPLLGPILATNPDFQKLQAGGRQVADGLATLNAGAPKLQAGAKAVSDGLSQAAPGAQELKKGLDQLVAGQTTVDQGMGSLAAGADKLSNGSNVLAAGTNQLAAGTNKLAAGTNQLAGGSSELVAGANQLSDGNSTLKGSWAKLTDGAKQIDNGMLQVSDGNQTVKAGWAQLTDGVKQVDDGVGQIEGGTKELNDGLTGGAEKVAAINAGEANMAQFASPVKTSGTVINEYPKYSYANAPYTLSLALFVGVLILTVLFNFRKPDHIEATGLQWYGGLFTKMAGLAVLQALVVSVFALFFIETANGFLFILFSVIASLAFLSIVFFLVALAGNIGRFVALAFLVMQLSTTGSALPVDMLPAGLRALSNFLPVTYSNNAFRGLISLDSTSFAWSNATMLLIYLAVGLVLSVAVAMLYTRRSSSRAAEA